MSQAQLNPAAVQRRIRAALLFLRDRQTGWGEFPARRYTNPRLEGTGLSDSSPFTTTFVLHALSFVDDPAALELKDRARAFLLQECVDPGLWTYWTPRQGTPIDPDLDDTCCASFALWGSQAGNRTAAPNTSRILANRHASGLFHTWLRAPVNSDADNDVDGAVNANVLLYLGERPETIPARDIVASAINEDREADSTWYYCHPFALYYMVSRAFYHGVTGFAGCAASIQRKTLRILASEQPNALSAALALCTLLNYASHEHPEVNRTLAWLAAWLADVQQSDGSWPRSAFYRGPEPPQPHAVWWGSEELTTAFCLEAFARAARSER